MVAPFLIVDAHQHFWDPRVNYHPWLCDQSPIPFRYGDYSSLRRPYLPADYFADAANHQVVKTVYVETEWDPRDPVGEMEYVEKLRRQSGFPTVAVAQAWLHRDDVGATLEALARHDFVRGIRHKPLPGQMDDARWRSGFAHLARRGLRFDLQAPWTQLAEAARLARDFPGASIVLNHTGLPADRSPAGIDAAQLPECLAGGLADSALLQKLYPRMVKRDFAPQGYVRQLLKDLEMVNEFAGGLKAPTPMMSEALTLYRMTAHLGHTELDTAAVLKLYER